MKPIDPTLFSVFSMLPGEGKTLCVVGNQITVKASGEDTEKDCTPQETTEIPLAERAAFSPLMEEEWVYMLEGELTFQLGDQALTLQQGGYLLAPRGILQTLKNEGETVARVLVIVSPSGLSE